MKHQHLTKDGAVLSWSNFLAGLAFVWAAFPERSMPPDLTQQVWYSALLRHGPTNESWAEAVETLVKAEWPPRCVRDLLDALPPVWEPGRPLPANVRVDADALAEAERRRDRAAAREVSRRLLRLPPRRRR